MSDGLIGAIVGGLVSLVTTFFVLRQQRIVDHTQRTFALKREIYQEAIGLVGKLAGVLASYADPFLRPDERMAELKNSAAGFYRLYLVAEPDTVKAINNAQEFYSNAALELELRSLEFKLFADALEADEKRSRITFDQLVRANEELTRRTSGPVSLELTSQIEQIRDSFAAWEVAASSIEQRREELLARIIDQTSHAIEASANFSSALEDVVVAIRRELGSEITTYDFDEVFHRQIEFSKSQAEKFRNALKEKHAESRSVPFEGFRRR